jgi:uroporphyrin-III C-methyltransferase/precorrin-2 dehydrogenase/sirohydrochlorin ferrochelatase
VNAPLRHPLQVKPPRMDVLARLPLFFALGGKRAVIAGGNAAAAWKTELLSAAGAAVEVYAAEPCEELLQLANDAPGGIVTVIRRAWTPDDLRGAALAIGAFDHDGAAETFAAAARAVGVPVNVIDKPSFCDFSFGAIVNRSPLVVGISTDGAAPVFAQAIRARIEALLPQGFSRWAAAAARWRAAVKASGLSFAGRRRFWQLFTARAVVHPDREPSQTDFQSCLADVQGLGAAVEHGSVTLLDAPRDPDLLTLRALRALQSADVILFDERVSHDVLDFARREARKISAGHRRDDIAALMARLAGEGKRVVRLTASQEAEAGRHA